MSRERDVQAFDARAQTYESDWRGRMHLEIATRTVDLALSVEDRPSRVLDIGCGTGMLLRLLADRLPDDSQEFLGIDAAAGMIRVAVEEARDPRLEFLTGEAEHLPYHDGRFDLVISTTSFDHWEDQKAGIQECFRVLAPGGHLVLTDLFSVLFVPTLVMSRRDRARTKRRANRLLVSARFSGVAWHNLYMGIIASVVAEK